jgi:drug/metabolite transporter (DMT)-like permease
MTTGAFLLVLLSAVFHATWNLFVKQSQDKAAFLWCAVLISFALYLPAALFFALHDSLGPLAILFCAGAALLHGVYGFALVRAYTAGDLSAVYPVARGTGPALVPIFAILLLGEHVSPMAAGGIALVVLGIYAISYGDVGLEGLLRPTRLLRRKETRWAFLMGLFIAGYTLWDKAALDHVPPVTLTQAAMVGHITFLAPLALRDARAPLRREWAQNRRSLLVAGILMPLGFILVLSALTVSRVSYVAPAREVGIVLGAALGIVLLREPHGLARIPGAALIASGVMLLAVAP